MKVGDRVICTYWDAMFADPPENERYPRYGTILKLNVKFTSSYCHNISWDDGETDTQSESYLELLTPLRELL